MIKRLRELPVWSYLILLALLLIPSFLLFERSALSSRIYHRCYNPGEVLETCFIDYYRDTALSQGTEAAIKELHERKEVDPRLAVSCHEAMHEIGHAAYKEYGSIAAAYEHADYSCWGGYLHGVVEAALAEKTLDDISPEYLRTMCDAAKTYGETSFLHFSCVHGVGHALMFVSNNDLPAALLRCDDLSNDWEENQCANGAFMQNLFSKYNDHDSKYLPTDDLHFPCNIAREKDQHPCYQVQGRLILDAYAWDFSKSFAFCADLPRKELQSACADGLGAAVSNVSQYAPKQVNKLCMLAGALEEDCLYGAMTDLEGVAGDESLGREVCALKSKPEAELCTQILERSHKDFPGSVKEAAIGG